MAYESPGGELGLVLEQLGYLKSEIDQRPGHADLKDLFYTVEKRIADEIVKVRSEVTALKTENEKLRAEIHEFNNGGLIRAIQRAIDARDAERDAERQRVVRQWFRQNWFVLTVFGLAMVSLHPGIRMFLAGLADFF